MIAWRGTTLTPKRYAARALAVQLYALPGDWLGSHDPELPMMTEREREEVAAQMTIYRDRLLDLLGEPLPEHWKERDATEEGAR